MSNPFFTSYVSISLLLLPPPLRRVVCLIFDVAWQSDPYPPISLSSFVDEKSLTHIQVRDDQYEYKVISDDHFDNEFGIYEAYKDGVLVPYPSRVEGTEMFQKARDAEAASVVAAAAAAAAASASTSASTRGRGRGRGGIKRKPAGDPDGIPTPKRSTRNTEESQLLSVPMAPAPAKGLLASAAEADIEPEGTPAEDESPSGTPEPTSFFASLQNKMPGKLIAREKSPPLPKNIGEPDDQGVRTYSQRGPARDKAQFARVMAPNVFEWEPHEIGFRDSANDASKGHTRAKRGKYLDHPNNNSMTFDQWCNSFDYSSMTPDDFDQELVEKHGVHPKFGIFLPTSKNDKEEPSPYVMPGKPVVFIANPSGRISHASRSYQTTVNHLRMLDSPYRAKISASMRRFCKLADIDAEEVSVRDYLPTDEELRDRSLGTAVQELESRPILDELSPEVEPEAGDDDADITEEARPDLSALTDAASYLDAQEASRPSVPAPKKPMKYDAVRDLFLSESKPPAPPPPPPAAANGDVGGLAVLADICSAPPKTLDWQPQNDRATASGYPSVAHDQPPMSSERENSYIPTTPAMAYQDPRMSVEAPQHSYPTARYPAEHFEASPYGSVRPAPHSQVEPSIYQGGQPESAPTHQVPPYAYGPPSDHSGYMPPQNHGYPSQDPREPHRETSMSHARPYEHGFEHRRMSSYAPPESPAYGRPYWHQQPPPGPPPPQPSAPPAPSQHYSLPPPPSSRMPYSHHASAEPLPPLRPPRGRNPSIQDEPLVDPAMRQPPQNSYNPFYTPSPSTRPFQNSYPPPDPHSSFQQSRHGERILPNPPPPGQGYMTSPTQSYVPPTGSPTFSSIQIGGGPPMGQNSPETPQGQGMTPNSAFRHRSTPSGSGPPSASSAAAADSKYRKLQPAPVPAHRAWTNKPELKTIPYDHKDSSGGSAALPNSGPTQIRGWNVNQHRRRNRSDKQDKSEAVSEREDSR